MIRKKSMKHKFVTLLCYSGGTICDGPDGVIYDKSPSKAIKIHCGIKDDELINRVNQATSINQQLHNIKIICRYPFVGIGKVTKYVPLHIKDDDDIAIMFDVVSVHERLCNLDLYLEIEEKEQNQPTQMVSRTQESILIEERSSQLKSHANVVSEMIQNENFNTISQIAVVNNAMVSGFDTENEVDPTDMFEEDGTRDGDDNEETEAPNRDEAPHDNESQVPSFFTSLEGVNMTTDGNWMDSHSKSKDDFTRELGKASFKDKKELIKAIKLHSIKTHRQYTVVETRPTIWSIRCKLSLFSRLKCMCQTLFEQLAIC
uniref:uncharacterized protein LOC122580536 isoform X2 n=1 Tax=Erigeron canadensis TaxID=72917 RepID=UPI001CB8A4DB|nr:uncharacterized protein LOC122580536 isoform X2 [Erigeron canadensis]